MKKLLLSFILMLGFGTTAFAQLTSVAKTATATVNVDVIQPLTITTQSNIDFGSITSDAGNVTLGAGGSLTTTGGGTATGTGTLGTFAITGAAGSTVSISGSVTGALGTGLTFTPTIIGGASSLTLDGGTGQVQVGGTLQVDAGTSAGTYQGEYTLSVAYTSV